MILDESLFEDTKVDEYLQYDNKRDEVDDEEVFDDSFLYVEEEQSDNNNNVNEDTESDILVADQGDLSSVDPAVEENAYANLIIDAINGEWDTVKLYQDIVNQLKDHDEYKDLTVVIDDIIKDEKNHVGNLQLILDTVSNKTLTDIKDGEEEAVDQLEGKEDGDE